ncbi:heavy metal translocating P-type ATPase [Thiobacter aerophilum]|uniref:Heavy metal translocating P-type ATPase n=1 Tax=Thiobacter aerophilum TaxID=3121275 RepID=A0ABV0EHK4_9BURK
MSGDCFHCGQPIPDDVALSVTIDGEPRAMCCRGCQAVAEAIVANHLEDYYRHRTAPATTPQELVPEALSRLAVYDHPAIQKSFVIDADEHTREAVLILEGITCAACIWLNERHLMQLPGVKAVSVNYATHRARIAWDERQISLSKILAEIRLLGYEAHPYNAHAAETLRRQRRSQDLRRLFVAGLASAQVMMFAIALYAGAYYYDMDHGTAQLMRWASLILSIPVVLYSAVPFYRAAWNGLLSRHLNMDVPVSLAVLSGFLGSAWVTWHGDGVVYFDTITMFVFILLASRFLEQGAREKSVEAAENLLKLAPAMATRVREGRQEVVPVLELSPGDLILAKPGEAIAADGVVVEGESSADEALLTGESRPVLKRPGDDVIAASVNLEGPLLVRVTGVGENTVLAGIVRLLDRAQAQKPRLAQLADQVAAYFTMALLLLALATGIGWALVAPERVFAIVLAVLVVTCPCALSIAAPAAIAAAGSSLLKRGILLTRGHALETLARVDHVVLDKTGTLTHGCPWLIGVIPFAELDAERAKVLAASLEQASEHPLAASFLAAVPAEALLPVAEAQNTPGLGVAGTIAGVRYQLGNARVLAQVPPLPADVPPGASVVWLAHEGRALAAFLLGDRLRPEAPALVRRLEAMGVGVSILSGDAEPAVRHVAQSLGVTDWRAQARPEDKLAALQTLQQAGKVVAMVGDGVNDAPVLAAAQVSIAMGGGTQVARSSSDIVLLSENLLDVAQALNTGRRAMAVMKSNFAWAVGYNLVALPFAVLGYIPPWVAAIGMSASSLIVVLNALRLK